MRGAGPVVISGFEPFAGMPSNPAGDAVRALRREGTLVAFAPALVLPVTYGGAARGLWDAARRERARACVMFGLAARSEVVRVEATAHNDNRARVPDNAGALHLGRPIDPRGPDALGTRVPVDPLVRALRRAGVPAVRSDDPGRFVCNDLYYRTLARGEELGGARSLFVHLPPGRALGGTVDEATLTAWVAIVAQLAPRWM